MHLELRIENAGWHEILRTYVERRIKFGLGRFGERVGRVVVQTGSKGPTKHFCRMQAEINPFGQVEVHEWGYDLFSAIDRATGRIGRIFGRRLSQVREAKIGRESIRLAA
jgi:hypothetical protein